LTEQAMAEVDIEGKDDREAVGDKLDLSSRISWGHHGDGL